MANAITGGIDEVFSRTDSTGTYTSLTDALGSTLVLADWGSNVKTQYEYDSWGTTTTTGGSNSDTFQYGGRENEGGGLYYNRNRYYDTTFERFLSQDPIGFLGGVNSYAYVLDRPTKMIDPFGLAGCEYEIDCIHPPAERRQMAINDYEFFLELNPPGMPKPPDPVHELMVGRGCDCRQRGEIEFNVPFTKVPVTISASATGFVPNYSTTNDVSVVIPTSAPLPSLGASLDITIDAPEDYPFQVAVGLGKNASVGTYVTPSGLQGLALSVGPSVGPPVSIAVPVGNACNVF